MVVAAAKLQLLVVLADARADGGGVGEIEGRARDGAQLAGGNEACVDGREAVGEDRDLVVEDVAGAGAGQVEIGVVGQVDDGVLVGGGGVFDAQLVLAA